MIKNLFTIHNIFLIILSILTVIWIMPHVTFFVNLLYFLILLIAFYTFYEKKTIPLNINYIIPIIIFFSCFVIWAFMTSLFIANDTMNSLNEFRGQLLKILVLCFSLYFIIKNRKIKINYIVSIIFFSLLFHFLVVDLYAIKYFFDKGSFPLRIYGLATGLDEINFITPFLLSIFTVEIIFRILKDKYMLPIGNKIFGMLFFFTLFSLIIQAKRNGIFTVSFMFISVILIVFIKLRKKVIPYLLIFSMIIAVFIGISIRDDSRWSSLFETIPIAMDIENNKAWLDWNKYEIPKLSDGSNIDHSTYNRIAWITAGAQIIKENPFGVGFGRNAFSHALEAKYNEGAGRHAHSGIIDLGVGTGVIGLILWILFMGTIIYKSFKLYIQENNYLALLSFFLTSSFFSRSFVDSVIRDHMLHQFLFFITIYLLLMLKEKQLKFSNS